MKVDPRALIGPALTDPKVPFEDWTRLVVVVRYGGGWSAEDAFVWAPDGTVTRFVLDGDDVGDRLDRLCSRQGARVAVLSTSRDAETAGLRLLYDDADAWFVPLGTEDQLVALVEATVGT